MNARVAAPFALLAIAAVAALTWLRSPPPAAEPPSAETAPPPAPRASTPAASSPSMSDRELMEFRIHIDHTQCEDGAKRVNELAGRPPTDPKGIGLLSTCLRIGNLAWYKCLLRAQTADQASACSRRLLDLDNPAF